MRSIYRWHPKECDLISDNLYVYELLLSSSLEESVFNMTMGM